MTHQKKRKQNPEMQRKKRLLRLSCSLLIEAMSAAKMKQIQPSLFKQWNENKMTTIRGKLAELVMINCAKCNWCAYSIKCASDKNIHRGIPALKIKLSTVKKPKWQFHASPNFPSEIISLTILPHPPPASHSEEYKQHVCYMNSTDYWFSALSACLSDCSRLPVLSSELLLHF